VYNTLDINNGQKMRNGKAPDKSDEKGLNGD